MTGTYIKAETRRGQLVAAARAVLEREGLAGATLRAVAAEAGASLSTMHYIFPSKEQLLRAVLEDVIEQITAAFGASASESTDLESAMRKSTLEVWSKLVETDTAQQVMQYELTTWALRTPGMADLAHRQYELYTDVITANWTQAAARAGVTLTVPPAELARLYLAGLDGLILQYLTLGDPERARTDLQALVHHTVRYATTG